MISGRFGEYGELFFFIVPVHVGDELNEILIGSQWLERMELVVNKPRGILTLEMVESE
jgi:predicted aspartyl protease